MLQRVLLLACAAAGTAAQTFYTGKVSNTLPPTVGACGRPCNGTITCKDAEPAYSKVCSGADAAVPYSIFFANYNASLPAAKNPICGHHVSSIGPVSTLAGTICSFCTEPVCGPTDLLLSDPAHNPGSVGEWILFSS